VNKMRPKVRHLCLRNKNFLHPGKRSGSNVWGDLELTLWYLITLKGSFGGDLGLLSFSSDFLKTSCAGGGG